MNQRLCCCSFFRVIYVGVIGAGLLLLLAVGNLNATEWSLNSSVSTRYEYNDNIFLTLQPESVSNIVMQPVIKFLAEEKNWETMFKARLRSNNYSNSNLDSNDQYYTADASYKRERDTYTIKGTYDLNSSLDVESDNFGLSRVRINRTATNISPSYSRMLTERLRVSFGYTKTESKYDDSVSSDFVSYEVDTGSTSLLYLLSEKNKLNASVQYMDYLSLNGLSEYQLLTLRAGLSRQFTENFMADFQIGASERDVINRNTSTIDFFGTQISLTQESDFNDSGFVLDAGFDLKIESGTLTGRLSRDNVTSSYGGVDEVNILNLGYKRRLSDLWSFALDGKYEKTEAAISSASFTDRNTLFINAYIDYSLDRDWKITASWHYLERGFITQNQVDMPTSNKLYIGMTYKFSELSTF